MREPAWWEMQEDECECDVCMGGPRVACERCDVEVPTRSAVALGASVMCERCASAVERGARGGWRRLPEEATA